MKHKKCQIFCLQEISEPLGTTEVLRQLPKRMRRIVRRRLRYLYNLFSKITSKTGKASQDLINIIEANTLKPGDRVRVRSKGEIRSTLDNWNRCGGCTFLEEMWPYCNSTQRVFKRVEKFLDERDYLTKRCKGIVLLEGIFCEGTKDFGTCDRSCFFFWREDWLEKID